MWEVLEHFDPWRLGHGVRSIEDAPLLDHLQQHQIHLEVCPTSNVMIDTYATYADHPIDRLYRAGIPVSVNSDARTLVPTTASQEYAALAQTFCWDANDFYQCNKNALNAAFLPDGVRVRLLAELADRFQPYL